MEKIREFIDQLLNWETNFKIYEYNENEYNCEISELYRIGFHGEKLLRDVDYLKSKWRQKFQADYFELQHPIINSVKTRAVANFSYWNATVKGNYVFMIDEKNSFPWIFLQAYNAFDVLLTQQGIFIRNIEDGIKKDNLIRLKYLSRDIKKINLSELQFQDTKFKCLINSPRPYHYFMEDLPSLIFMECRNVSKNSFFIPKYCKQTEEGTVDIYPNVFAYLPNFHDKLISLAFQYVVKESLEDQSELCDKKYDLKIWLSFPSESRRRWINLEQSIVTLIENLSIYFKKILIYFDGMTAFDGKTITDENSKHILRNIKKYIAKKISTVDCKFVSLIGLDYRTKIFYCSQVDFAIAELGTSVMIPGYILNKPVLGYFGSNDFIAKIRKKIDIISISQSEYIKTVNYKNNLSFDYYISDNHIYNLAVDVIEKIKDIKMHRLDVLPVDLVVNCCEMEQKYKIKFSIECVALYNEYKNILNNKIEQLHDEIQKFQNIQDDINKKNESFFAMIQEKELKCSQILEEKYQHQISKLVLDNNIIRQQNQHLIKKINENNCFVYLKENESAKLRVREHLAYKLGQAMIINSKSLLGYIKMPFVFHYIKVKHKQEQMIYKQKILENPALANRPLEDYPDYSEALKEKECLTYKLGEALIKADKTWYKGGYVRLIFEIRKIKLEFKTKREKK
ncbi:hypothetical protein CK600_05530 [Campylobacter coli]|nr:hypothetical protein [Campylobacter coli]EAO7356291.1 hypothetical protein [Campylobacter coli]EJN4898063.1 hypothetical protein [Campylobacter coli]HEB8303273.1 hypothetical protein [Campylobacter coli]HEB8311665.1 hypothetical protein [Campylobacter coli]